VKHAAPVELSNGSRGGEHVCADTMRMWSSSVRRVPEALNGPILASRADVTGEDGRTTRGGARDAAAEMPDMFEDGIRLR